MTAPVSRANTSVAVGRDWTAIILAVGLGLAINTITVAVLIDAIVSNGPGLSENATQILTTAFGGIIGVLGSYVGYRAASSSRDQGQADVVAAAAAAAPPPAAGPT